LIALKDRLLLIKTWNAVITWFFDDLILAGFFFDLPIFPPFFDFGSTFETSK